MKRRRVLFIRLSQFRLFIRKFLIAVLFVSALALMMLSKADSLVLEKTSDVLLQVFNPVIRVVQLPAQFVYGVYGKIKDVSRVYAENKKLKKEHADRLLLKNRLRTLEAENKLLARLLNYTPPPEATFVTAKIIAEEGDGFSHSLIAYVGKTDKVKEGQVVLGGESVVGRVETVAGKYVRVLLFTDINSKIPVIVERSRERGILSGDNTTVPKLQFTALNADIKPGDMLVTSGVAGIFPAGLPVGIVSRIGEDETEVETITDIPRVEYVRIGDYGIYDDVVMMTSENEE